MVEQILSRYPRDQTSLVMVLQDVQEEHGYLSPEALEEVSRALQIPRAQVYAVATFYRVLSLEPRGRHTVRVCTGTACHVRQASLILEAAERELGVGVGHTTEDRAFTLERVGCIGACAIGPVMEIDERHHGLLTVPKIGPLLRRARKADAAAEGAAEEGEGTSGDGEGAGGEGGA